jgi:alpha-1,6-mannosyltransferase
VARPPAGTAGVVKDDSVAPAALFGSGLVIGGCILGIVFFDRRTYPLVFIGCSALAGVAYLRTLRLLGRVTEGSNRVLALCLVIAAVWRVPLLLEPPTLSTDVYRYVWDGRIQRLGYDPYLVAPGNSKFRRLHTAETRLINHSDVATPYPAAAELFFRAVMTVNESALAMKSAVVLCDACIVAVLFYWLQALRRRTWWVLAYAWNPLVALEGAGNGHVDLLGTLCLVLTAASLARGRRTIASIAFALGVGVKFLPAMLVPLLWRRIRLRDAALGGAVLAALYIPFLGHGNLPFGSLGDYLAYWRVNAPVYSALERVFPTASLIVVPIAFGLAVAFWTRWHFPLESPEAWAWPVAGTLFFAPTIFPWYLLWLTPFLFTSCTFPLAVWTVSSLSAYWWLPSWIITAVQYGAALGAVGWMLAPSVGARRAMSSSV